MKNKLILGASNKNTLTTENINVDIKDVNPKNVKPFKAKLHPINKISQHKIGSKHLLTEKVVEDAISSLSGKPIKSSHYNGDGYGIITSGKIVDYENEKWVEAEGYITASDEEEYMELSKSLKDLGISYEIETEDYIEAPDMIIPNKYRYKAIAFTPENESAYQDAKVLMADKNGGKEMAEGISIEEAKKMAQDAITEARKMWEKENEGVEILQAKDSEISALTKKNQEILSELESLKKAKEELTTKITDYEKIKADFELLKKKEEETVLEKVKLERTQKVKDWLDSISDEKEKTQVSERITKMSNEDFELFANNISVKKGADGQINPNNYGVDGKDRLKTVSKDTINKLFTRVENKQGGK